jgi:hypothetical protein
MDSKICSNCKKELTIDNFHKKRAGKFGVRSDCRECYNKRNNPPNEDINIKQTCTGCGKEFPATLKHFHRQKLGKFGVRDKCKECRNKRQKERNIPPNTDINIKQTCTGDCGNEFPATLDYFYKKKNGKFGVRSRCKECSKKRDKERNKPINTDINIKQTCTGICVRELPATLEFFHKNKKSKFGVETECKECRSQWQKDNRDKINEYIKNKYQNDQQYRIRQLLSRGLWRALNNIGRSKNASILDYIGCDIAFLQQHLNKTKDDSWGDVVIDIDHIIPQSLYDHTNEEEIKKCWNWRNLRYFPKSDNISKGNILDMSLVKQYGIDDLLPDF